MAFKMNYNKGGFPFKKTIAKRNSEIIDVLDEELGAHFFPPLGEDTNRKCPLCNSPPSLPTTKEYVEHIICCCFFDLIMRANCHRAYTH